MQKGETANQSVHDPDTPKNKRQQEMKYHQDRMAELDKEMKGKVIELHHMLAKSGLSQSAELLEQCFDTRTGEPKDNCKQNKFKLR